MDFQRLIYMAEDYTENSPLNYVSESAAISPELVSMRMFNKPLIGAASSDDECFASFKDTGVVGPHFMSPAEWLPGAKSVVSLFFPFMPDVLRSNAAMAEWPSNEWLHARIEGQMFINSLMEHLKVELIGEGYGCVVPSSDPRFKAADGKVSEKLPGLNFTSVWSERHVAFACGLGTFSLSKGLITRSGVAGRFGSLVTSLELSPSGRSYSDVFEYCSMCGACIKKCPVSAISFENGKDHRICSDFLDVTNARYLPRYGCGKCQVGVPCQSRAPGIGA